MTMIVADIETIPADGPDAYRAAVAEMAEAAGKDVDAFAALSPALTRVVAVGMQQVETGKSRCAFDGSLFGGLAGPMPEPSHVAYGSEAELLAHVNGVLSKATSLVTFNGRSYDVPVLVHRMVARGVTPCSFLLRAARESRYPNWKGTPRLHVDVREQMTFFGAANGAGTSLRAFAIGYGLPDPKAHGDGGGVAELVKQGDAAGLCEYCLGDVKTAVGLYMRWLEACGVA